MTLHELREASPPRPEAMGHEGAAIVEPGWKMGLRGLGFLIVAAALALLTYAIPDVVGYDLDHPPPAWVIAADLLLVAVGQVLAWRLFPNRMEPGATVTVLYRAGDAYALTFSDEIPSVVSVR